MKIADSDTIRTGESELLDTLKEKLDSKAVKAMATQSLQMEDMTFRGGDIVIHDNKIAYKLELEAKVVVSLLFDRDGNTLSSESDNDDTNPRFSDNNDEKPDASAFNDTLDSEDSPDDHEAFAENILKNEENQDPLETILQRNRSFWLEKSGTEVP